MNMIRRLISENYIKRLISAGIVLSFLMTGVVLAKTDTIAIKADINCVYQNVAADTVIDAYERSGSGAYKGKCYAVVGRITDVSADGRSFVLRADDRETAVTCSTTANLFSMVSHTYFSGDSQQDLFFKVLGKLTSSDKELSMEVEHVYLSDGTVDGAVWSLESDGESDITYNVNETYNRQLKDDDANIGEVLHYEIPKSWKQIEEELPNVEGFQYRLNELDKTGVPESLFIFYVDNDHLRLATDKDKTEKFNDAVVCNIRGNGTIVTRSYKAIDDITDIFIKHEIVRQEIGTDYADLIYYVTDFKDDNNNDYSQHRVEFIFLPRTNIDVGPRVLLYVYPIDGPSETHRSDILYVLRSMFM